MRSISGASLALLLASGLMAQYRVGAPIVTGGFGNAVFPAGTPANSPNVTRFTPNAVFPAGGGPRLVIPGQRAPRYTGTGAIAVPFAYPVYIGSGSYFDAGYPYPAPSQQPNVTVVYPPQPPPVIVNQFGPGAQAAPTDAGPEPRETEPSYDEPNPQLEHYLIALKDHTVYSVVAYWVDGDTLHYFTAGNVHNQVSLSLVDRDLTSRLNKESGVDVNLPAAK